MIITQRSHKYNATEYNTEQALHLRRSYPANIFGWLPSMTKLGLNGKIPEIS